MSRLENTTDSSLTALFSDQRAYLSEVLRRQGCTSEQVELILSDAHVQAWKSWGALQDVACFRGWILKITIRCWYRWCAGLCRDREAARPFAPDQLELETESPAVKDFLHRQREDAALATLAMCLDCLSQKDRELVLWHHTAGPDPTRWKMSSASYYRRLAKIYAQLEECFKCDR